MVSVLQPYPSFIELTLQKVTLLCLAAHPVTFRFQPLQCYLLEGCKSCHKYDSRHLHQVGTADGAMTRPAGLSNSMSITRIT